MSAPAIVHENSRPEAVLSRAANFDRLVWAYRWMEWISFGPWLGWCRNAYLNELCGRGRGLVLGDGDGRFTASLLKTDPEIRVDAVDASAAMLRALVKRAGANATRVKAFRGDAREWRPAREHYDLVVTHFFLDCLTTQEVKTLAQRVRGAATADAIWVVSEFAIPAGRFGRWLARPLVWALYSAFGLLTGLKPRSLPEYAAALRQAGFVRLRQRRWLKGLLVSELWMAGRDVSLLS